ncbi:GDP-mannose mannosyl hydrolase [Alteromonas sp. 1_MG-2023]|uniref:GDP-mannose mannosyl hydrolase n=1 Tax=Alteromonas sp. 1_MG-2023 TaxID=3062669 RepID=UPI0026E36A42|nr:GDP-mannose mannosyl hydrolase [Alteromonas sp. 1_MG-2023]MDO6567901.1 GDP-mannose mannosyl hydrolase [Alteromonas sp. 1_MG-2023]
MAFLEKNVFTTVINSTPLVSIDLLIENPQGQVLLGYRNNRPAEGYWFVPGGRILKDESMNKAFKRLTLAELGLVFERKDAEFLGPYEHFYNDYVFGEGVTTHYVVLGYKLVCDLDISSLPSAQHNKFKWFEKCDMLASDNVHEHSKWYVE